MQFINACEAIYKFKSCNNILVLLHIYLDDDINFIYNYKGISLFNEVIFLKKAPKPINIYRNIKFINCIREYNYNSVFIGYFSDRIREFISNLSYNELFVIDDGNYSLVLYYELCYNDKYLKKNSMLKSVKVRNNKRLSKKYLYRIYEYALKNIYKINNISFNFNLSDNKINFFSLYKLKKTDLCSKIIENKYDYLSKIYRINYSKKIIKNYVYFLGQPLKKTIGISDKEYIEYIKIIISFYKNKNMKVIYILHNNENINMYKSLFSNNIIFLDIKEPFEFFIIKQKNIPYNISSFYSSALFTINKIFNNLKLCAFRLNFSRPDIDLIYKHLEDSGIDIKSLDNK